MDVFAQLFGPQWGPMIFTTVKTLAAILLIVIPVMLSVAYLTFAERKVIGYMQVRIGPNRVGPKGWLQPVADGDVALAAKLLGRPHVVRGRVVHGAGRGRQIGFATANVRPRTQLVPAEGVYATRAEIDRQWFDGVTSIGTTPTFGGTESVIESHLFTDWQDFYAKPIRLRFYERIREQRKFESPDALRRQIQLDVESARAILARTSV